MSNAFNTGEFQIAPKPQFNTKELTELSCVVAVAIMDANRIKDTESVAFLSKLQTKIHEVITGSL